MPQIHLFTPKSATPEDWAEYHRYRRQRAAEDDPGEPIYPDADFEADLIRDWPLNITDRLIATEGRSILASLGISYRRPGTEGAEPHAPFAYLFGGTTIPHRRRGLASALLRAALPRLDALGKTTLTFSTHLPETEAFLTAIGATLKHRAIENRLDLTALDWPMLTAWHTTPEGLTWEIHTPRLPLDRQQALYPQFTDLLRTIPLGDLETAPMSYETARTQTWYEELDRHGGSHHLVLLMQGETVAGLCESSHDPRFPDRVWQALTAVAPAFRGRGIAKSLKSAMHRLIRDAHPEASWMITGNANVNAPMLSINRRLGFRQHRQDTSWQLTRDALADHLACTPAKFQ